ncbi:hypothetical protein PV326_009379 [Microctonus aethiopoides]|nr:hypothetical protein PV326_009379 [Microctonus aethiopoides]
MIAVCVMALALVLPVQSAWDASLGANAGFRVGYKSDPKPVQENKNIIPDGLYPIPERPNISEIDVESFVRKILATQDCYPHCQSDNISGRSNSREMDALLKQFILLLAEEQMNKHPSYYYPAQEQKKCTFFQRVKKAAQAIIGECIADRRKK